MRTRYFFFIATAFAAIACTKDIATESTNGSQQEVRLVPMTFTAGSDDASDPESKVSLGGEDLKSVLWSAGDQIKVFDGKTNDLPAFNLVSGEGETSGVFSGKVSEGLPEGTTFYALYPYQADAEFHASYDLMSGTNVVATYSNAILATVPSEQIAVPNSVPSNAFIAAAFTDSEGNFKFQNVLGLIKFQLSETDVQDLVSVSISGNNYDYIAGDICISFDEGTTSVKNDYIRGKASSYVTLTPKEGESFQANIPYYFAIRSSTFNPSSGTKGFTLTAKYADDSCKHISTNSAPAQSVSRNTVLNLGTVPFKTGLPNDLYIAYLHGQNIDAAGITINKETYSDASIIKDNNKAASGASVVYFIKPGLTGVTVAQNAVNKFIIVGSDAKNRSSVSITKQIQPTSSASSVNTVILKNLDASYTPASTQLINMKSDFSTICIDNCSIKNLQHTIINAVDGSNNYKCDKISIIDSELQLTNRATIYLYYTKNTDSEASTEVSIKNNIIYYTPTESVAALTEFRIIAGAPAFKSVNVSNNTLDKTGIPNNGMITYLSMQSCNIENNIFNETVLTDKNSQLLNSIATQATGTVDKNYFYTTSSYVLGLIGSQANISQFTTKSNPVKQNNAILASDWDPVNGVFNTTYTLPDGVTGVGAKR